MPIVELWKDYGITSNEFARRYKLNNNLDSVCYAGRLDPMACGKMIILTNGDTKNVNTYLDHDKLYNFDLIIGIDTKSHDCLSEINKITEISLKKENLISKLSTFIKSYTVQKYPIVSNYTIKHNGIKKPLWWFYTNGYLDVELPSKNVIIFDSKINNIQNVLLNTLINKFIDRIKLIDNEKTIVELKTSAIIKQWKNIANEDVDRRQIVVNIELKVSSGFYIRQFCNDFGKYIGGGAIAFDITRLKII
jgi:tRNA U55 pseudouridine synthase TruB